MVHDHFLNLTLPRLLGVFTREEELKNEER
jgi:hypothetical protein